MKLFNMKKTRDEKTAVIIQCRLSSTRLPGKALLDLGGKPVLEWTLAAMKKVKADRYFLAVDTESEKELSPIAKKCGYEFFAGSQQDVLKRFCDVIELSGVDVVLRGTADNPFLFHEAASSLMEEYLKRDASTPVDYITYSGLPHGSGIEIFNAHSLLDAATRTEDPYDHEHVGPALYNHQDRYRCEFLEAPKRFNHPHLRTTIDLPSDYRRALRIVDCISGGTTPAEPYSTEEILSALEKSHIKYPFVLIPSIHQGQGTGHLRRCLDIARETGCDIFIPDFDHEESEGQKSLGPIIRNLVEQSKAMGLKNWQIVSTLQNPEQYNLTVTDSFVSDSAFLKTLTQKCPVACIDEGNPDTDMVDYLLDIIPGLETKTHPNLENPELIPLPTKRKSAPCDGTNIEKILVVFGGEDPFDLTVPCVEELKKGNYQITAIKPGARSDWENVTYCDTIPDLKEHLYEYDLVITHYGFTAYEAKAAGCAVILIGPTELHSALSRKWGFPLLEKKDLSYKNLLKLMSSEEIIPLVEVADEKEILETEEKDCCMSPVSRFVRKLSQGQKLMCPICREKDVSDDKLVDRTSERTFRRCSRCGIIYMSWTVQSQQTVYDHQYFFDDYQSQYGKTYLEDFDGIKCQCLRRVDEINRIYKHFGQTENPSILDIGCAMGPFMDAASEKGWQVYGTDICSEAVEYVKDTLHYPAVCSSFPDFDAACELGLDSFDAVTMWFVIEHFQDLDRVLKQVSALVKKGGIFAFSTPSGSGIMGKYNTHSFFVSSPQDHYTIWEPGRAAEILEKYGFKVEKMVSTGIHPERLPKAKKEEWSKDSLKFRTVKAAGKMMMLGDTFEVYCKKIF